MARKYHSIIVKHTKNDPWSIQWGDYDKEVCKQELEDSYADEYKAKIITTVDAKQSTIEQAVKLLNEKE